MSFAGSARHALYARLEDVLGTEHADTLMAHLPTSANDEAATRGDIVRLETHFDALESRLDALESRLDRLEGRFDRLEERFDRFESRIGEMYDIIIEQQRFYTRNTVWSMVGMTAIFSLIVTLVG
ncbi:MAG: hypothetical protein R2823_08785 [Acidimicrobiia bacterium]